MGQTLLCFLIDTYSLKTTVRSTLPFEYDFLCYENLLFQDFHELESPRTDYPGCCPKVLRATREHESRPDKYSNRYARLLQEHETRTPVLQPWRQPAAV